MGQNLVSRPHNKSAFMDLGAMQTVAFAVAGGAAALSAAITSNYIRVTVTTPAVLMFTVAGSVTATTGHYLAAGIPYDLPRTGANTKVSVLGATAAVGNCYISELV